MSPKLPLELFDQAIDHLWVDVPSLKACALTCHAWLPSARTHLFRDERLIGEKSCARFEAFLESSPDVARYFRKLSITEPMSTAYAQHWLNRIPALVAKLDRLTTLELVGLHYVSLAFCPPETLSAFSRLTNLVFAEVYFNNVMDALALLSASHNVQEVCFYRVGWGCSSPAYAAPPQVTPPRRLRRLVVDSWASSMVLQEWLFSAAELDVRTLMVRWRERDAMDVLNALFRACGPALQHLYIELPTTIEGSQEMPSLYYNTHLRALEIDGLVLPEYVPWVSALLQQMRSTQLESLSISMLVLRPDVLASFGWDQLDAILAQPHLVNVALTVTVNRAFHPHNDPETLRSAVMALLPGTAGSGRLVVRCF